MDLPGSSWKQPLCVPWKTEVLWNDRLHSYIFQMPKMHIYTLFSSFRELVKLGATSLLVCLSLTHPLVLGFSRLEFLIGCFIVGQTPHSPIQQILERKRVFMKCRKNIYNIPELPENHVHNSGANLTVSGLRRMQLYPQVSAPQNTVFILKNNRSKSPTYPQLFKGIASLLVQSNSVTFFKAALQNCTYLGLTLKGGLICQWRAERHKLLCQWRSLPFSCETWWSCLHS